MLGPGSLLAETFDLPLSFRLTEEPEIFLENPVSLEISSTGRVAMWDANFSTYRFINLENFTPGSPVIKPEISSYREKRTGKFLRESSITVELNGFWDDYDEYWYFDKKLALTADSFYIQPFFADSPPLEISGPVRRIFKHDNQLFIQPDTGLLTRIDETNSQVLSDTVFPLFRGDAVGVTDGGKLVTRSGDTVFIYDTRRLVESRSYSGLIGLDIEGDNIYFLKNTGRIVKYKVDTGIEYVFDSRQEFTPVDFAVHQGTGYILADKALYETELEIGRRIFFFLSRRYDPDPVIDFSNYQLFPRSSSKIWFEKDETVGETVFLYMGGDSPTRVKLTDRGESREIQEISWEAVPVSAVQYLNIPQSIRNSEGLIYYFFRSEMAVGAYNRDNELVEQINLDTAALQYFGKLEFVGVDEQYLGFSGKVIVPGIGDQRVVMLIDRQGSLERVLPVPRVSELAGWPNLQPSGVHYGGDGFIYILFPDYIQRFDKDGFPRGVIEGLRDPVYLTNFAEGLLVLEKSGEQLSIVENKPSVPSLYRSPRRSLMITEAYRIDHNQTLFYGKEGIAPRSAGAFYEYDHSTGKFEDVLRRTAKTPRFFYVDPDANRLYFWESVDDRGKYRLLTAERGIYRVSETGIIDYPVGTGDFLVAQNMLVFPAISGSGDTKLIHRYHRVGESDSGVLKNSSGLQQLGKLSEETELFYSVKQEGPEWVVNSGYVQISGETVVWQEKTEIYRSENQIVQVVKQGTDRYLLLITRGGISELISWDERYEERKSLLEIVGELELLKPLENGPVIGLLSADDQGYLVEIATDGEISRGGVRGRIVSDGPVSLSGIPLFLYPGGRWFETDPGGLFMEDKLPAGYVELYSVSYSHHLSSPFSKIIQPDQFGEEQTTLLYPPEPVPLLETAVKYYQKGDYGRARSRLELFVSLVEDGRYHQYAIYLLKDSLLELGETGELLRLFENYPDIFNLQNKLVLFSKKTDPGRFQLVDYLKNYLPADLQKFLTYSRDILYLDRSREKSAIELPELIGSGGLDD